MSTVTDSRYAVRELPVDEWPKLLEIDGPYQTQGSLPDAHYNRIIVEEVEGEIIGYWGAFTVVHTEPVWLHPAYRMRTGAVKHLWEGMRDLLVRMKVPGTVAIIEDKDAPINLPMATKLGFVKVPGSLYFLDLRT
jgi:hypothetical protein